jgi:23S rRNA (adenine2503-C2)-methyltransferase
MPETLETESVIIPMQRRHETTLTLCVSSQVGCAMGCTFCETAQMGLIRSLTAAEIVAQVWIARHHLKRPVRNVVFMGMGEPLDNLDNVLRAVDILADHRGLSIGISRITISTVGRIDGLMKLAEVVKRPGRRTLNLAVSINAPSNEVRNQIMPINRSMPLDELVPILETWPRRKSGAICLEYVLIPGVNDRREHAEQVATLFRNVRGCVNVIPYNPRRNSPWPAPDEADVTRFLTDLESFGQFCKRRRTKGRDTMAACGQLGNEAIRKRQVVTLGIEGSALT